MGDVSVMAVFDVIFKMKSHLDGCVSAKRTVYQPASQVTFLSSVDALCPVVLFNGQFSDGKIILPARLLNCHQKEEHQQNKKKIPTNSTRKSTTAKRAKQKPIEQTMRIFGHLFYGRLVSAVIFLTFSRCLHHFILKDMKSIVYTNQ